MSLTTRYIKIDISHVLSFARDKAFTWQGCHCGKDALVGYGVGTQLAIDHILSRRTKIHQTNISAKALQKHVIFKRSNVYNATIGKTINVTGFALLDPEPACAYTTPLRNTTRIRLSRSGGRVAMRRTANPYTSVRFRPGPPRACVRKFLVNHLRAAAPKKVCISSRLAVFPDASELRSRII